MKNKMISPLYEAKPDINDLMASWLSPSGCLTAVEFIYGRFGVAFFESTPYTPVRALPCPPCNIYIEHECVACKATYG